jgi:hypothetical protein
MRTLGELLRGAKEVLGSQRGQVYANMHSRMLYTIFHPGWELVHEALLYYQIGLLPNVARLTMEHYYEMFLLHLRTLGTTRPDDNRDILDKLHTMHQAEKLRILRILRCNASSRGQFIMQN